MDAAVKLLDSYIPKQEKTLEQILKGQSISSSEELIEVLQTVTEQVSNDVKEIPERQRLLTLAVELTKLVKNAITADDEPREDAKDSSEGTEDNRGFPDRVPERQALFTSSIAGPLFTSVAAVSGSLSPSTLPQGVHVSRVIPTPPAEFHALGDLVQTSNSMEESSTLLLHRQPVPLTRDINFETFQSFGPLHDQAEGFLTARSINAYTSTHQDMISTHGTSPSRESQEPQTTEHEATLDNLDFDDDLLSAFESTKDQHDELTTSLLRLSELQDARVGMSPFGAPSNAEQDLGREILEMMRQKILAHGLQPKELLAEVSHGYSFAKFTTAYNGLLPPTIAQAIRATQTQLLPQISHPLG